MKIRSMHETIIQAIQATQSNSLTLYIEVSLKPFFKVFVSQAYKKGRKCIINTNRKRWKLFLRLASRVLSLNVKIN